MQCIQTIDLDGILCLSVKITVLSQTNCLLLACGLSNSKVQLYLNDFSNSNPIFVAIHSLLGHEDWVRSLDFISEGNFFMNCSYCNIFLIIFVIALPRHVILTKLLTYSMQVFFNFLEVLNFRRKCSSC